MSTNFENRNLTIDKIYTVIGIDDENFRVINDQLEPILYRKNYFKIIDSKIPEDWIRLDYPDGEYFIDPPEMSGVGFYEDYFDNDSDAINIFNNIIKNLH